MTRLLFPILLFKTGYFQQGKNDYSVIIFIK